jgi:electron transfer flavoprotein alpha/beta subunit
MAINTEQLAGFIDTRIQSNLAELIGPVIEGLENRFTEQLDQYAMAIIGGTITTEFNGKLNQAWEEFVLNEANRIMMQRAAENGREMLESEGPTIVTLGEQLLEEDQDTGLDISEADLEAAMAATPTPVVKKVVPAEDADVHFVPPAE